MAETKTLKTKTLVIEQLGALGDGIAYADGEISYVPFALGDEVVEASGKGPRLKLENVKTPSPERVEPPCPHFTQCGGCQLQHMNGAAYREWKQDLLVQALLREGIETPPLPLVHFDNTLRRRAVFTLKNTGDGLSFGFAEKASHDIINVEHCLVLVDAINEKLEAIKALAGRALMGKHELRAYVLAADNGLDINLETEHVMNDQARQNLVKQGVEAGILRLCVNGEPLFEQEKPSITLKGKKADYSLSPPPSGFLQAIEPAQDMMISQVIGHLKSCKQVADLFCGSGTFSLPLAERSVVAAYEFDKPALTALDEAWRASAGKLKAISALKRDLIRSPVTFQELKKIDGVVFDPPRAGAEAQAKQLVKAIRLKRVAAVSCNPITLARDLKILLEGGFKIKSITPIDQFQFTPHLEVVALLER